MLFILGLIIACYLYLLFQNQLVNEMRFFIVFLSFLLSLCLKEGTYSKNKVIKIQWLFLFIMLGDFLLFNEETYYFGILFYIIVMSILFLFVSRSFCFIGEIVAIISLIFLPPFEIIIGFYIFMLTMLCIISCIKENWYLLSYLFLFVISDILLGVSYLTNYNYTYISWIFYIPALLCLIIPGFLDEKLRLSSCRYLEK